MKLCLGTAQLGMDYGINNNTALSKKDPKKIMNTAISNGIITFDTAAGYGTSEQILGEYFLNKRLQPQIITKCGADEPEELEDSLKVSLGFLKQSKVNGVLFHKANHMYNKALVNKLINLKEKNYIENIGVSVYEPKDAVFAIMQEWVDYIQIPYNLLDQRLHESDFFSIASSKNKTIFARSILLQGLLVMSFEEVLHKMSFAALPIKTYEDILKKYNLNNLQAAIGYVKNNKQIDYLIFGVDNYKQLELFVSTFNSIEIPEECTSEFKREFNKVDKRILSPNLW